MNEVNTWTLVQVSPKLHRFPTKTNRNQLLKWLNTSYVTLWWCNRPVRKPLNHLLIKRKRNESKYTQRTVYSYQDTYWTEETTTWSCLVLFHLTFPDCKILNYNEYKRDYEEQNVFLMSWWGTHPINSNERLSYEQ